MGISSASLERASAIAVSEISMPVTRMPCSRNGLALRPYPMPGISTLFTSRRTKSSRANKADTVG